jgi:hypothetical protein
MTRGVLCITSHSSTQAVIICTSRPRKILAQIEFDVGPILIEMWSPHSVGEIPSIPEPPKRANARSRIEFGTTNSSIACADCSGEVQLAKFRYLLGPHGCVSSRLYLQQLKECGVSTLKSWTGPEGIEQYRREPSR